MPGNLTNPCMAPHPPGSTSHAAAAGAGEGWRAAAVLPGNITERTVRSHNVPLATM